MKKIVSILLAVLLTFSVSVIAFAENEPLNAQVYVTISDKGDLVVPDMPVLVLDIDKDGALTVNDALYCTHEVFFEGGAAEGYVSTLTEWGLSIAKLWGDTNRGGFGYYVDNNMCWSLTDAITEGCHLVAFNYADSFTYSDMYTFFDDAEIDEDNEMITLTLKGYSYDADWNLVAAPIADAPVCVDFDEENPYTTDENGTVVLPYYEYAYYTYTSTVYGNVVPAIYNVHSSEEERIEISELGTCEATLSDGTAYTFHKEMEPVNENVTEADCVNGGHYDAVTYCENCNIVLNTESVDTDPLGHKNAKAVKENEVKPSCIEAGSYDSVVYCTVCKEEISRKTVNVPALGHKAGEAVKENEVKAEYNKKGSYESVVYCTVCGEEISRETIEIPAKTGIIEAIKAFLNQIVEFFRAIFKIK